MISTVLSKRITKQTRKQNQPTKQTNSFNNKHVSKTTQSKTKQSNSCFVLFCFKGRKVCLWPQEFRDLGIVSNASINNIASSSSSPPPPPPPPPLLLLPPSWPRALTGHITVGTWELQDRVNVELLDLMNHKHCGAMGVLTALKPVHSRSDEL